MIDEIELLQQLKSESKKEQAFRTLITLYKERLYWHIRNIIKSHDDADDVLQNTFIKVFKAERFKVVSYVEFAGESKYANIKKIYLDSFSEMQLFFYQTVSKTFFHLLSHDVSGQ